MVVAILCLCIPLTAMVTGFFTLKAVQMGLRWQIETQRQEKPTMDPIAVPSPFRSNEPKVDMNEQTLDEWLNGPKEEVT